jgi:hypothetical protein
LGSRASRELSVRSGVLFDVVAVFIPVIAMTVSIEQPQADTSDAIEARMVEEPMRDPFVTDN